MPNESALLHVYVPPRDKAEMLAELAEDFREGENLPNAEYMEW